MAKFNRVTNVTTNTDIVDVRVDQILCDLFAGNEATSKIMAAPRPNHYLFDFPIADAPTIGEGELVGLKANIHMSAIASPDNFTTPMASLFKLKKTGLLNAEATTIGDEDVVTLAGSLHPENVTFEENFSPVTDEGRDLFEEKALRKSYVDDGNYMEWEYAFDNQFPTGRCSDRTKFKDRYSERIGGGENSGRRVVYVEQRGAYVKEWTPTKGKKWYDPWEPMWLDSQVTIQNDGATSSSATSDSDINYSRPKGLHIVNSFSSPDVTDANNLKVCEARSETDTKTKRTGNSSLRLHTFWDISGTGGVGEILGSVQDYTVTDSFLPDKDGTTRTAEQVAWTCLAIDQQTLPNPVRMDYKGTNGASRMGSSIEVDFAIGEMSRTWKDKAVYDVGAAPGQRHHRFKRTFTVILSENPPDSDQDLTSFLTRELTTQSSTTGVVISRINASAQHGADDYVVYPIKQSTINEVSGDYPATSATSYDATSDPVRNEDDEDRIGFEHYDGSGGDEIDGSSAKPTGFGPNTNNLVGLDGFINRGPLGSIYNSIKQGAFNRLSFIFRPEGVFPKTSATQGPGSMYGDSGGGHPGCYIKIEQIADSTPIGNNEPFTDSTGETEFDDHDVEGTDIAYSHKGGTNMAPQFINSFDSMPRFISLWVNNWPINASGTNANDASYPANKPSTVTVNVDKVCFKNWDMGIRNATASLQNVHTANIKMPSSKGVSYKGQTDVELKTWAFGFDNDSDIEGATRYLYFNNFSTDEVNKSKPIKMFSTEGTAEGSHKQSGLNVGYTRLEKLGYQGSRATLSPSTKNAAGSTVDGYGLSLLDECVVQNYSKIQTRADSSDNLDGTYFTINDHDGNNYHVWFDVDNSGTSAPSVSNSTAIEVTGVTTNMSAINVAGQVVSTLNAYKVGDEQIWHASNKYPDATTAGTIQIYVLFVQTGKTAPTLGAGTSGFPFMVSYANNSTSIENHLVDGFTGKGYARFNFTDANFKKRECIYAASRVSAITDAGGGKIRISNPDVFKNHANDEYIMFVQGMEYTDRTVTITSVAAAGSGAENTTIGSIITASTSHLLLPGDQVKFSGGNIPSELSTTITYTVATTPSATTFTVITDTIVNTPYDNRRVNIAAQTDDFTMTVLGGDYQKTFKILEAPDEDNVITVDANLETYKEEYWNTATKGKTFISPKKYWVYMAFEMVSNDDKYLSDRTYGTVHTLNAALGSLGTTFNEYTYTEDAINQWNLSPSGDNSFVVLDEYGFGPYNEETGKGGMVSKQNLKLNSFVEFDCTGMIKDNDVDLSKNVSMMLSPESPHLDYSFSVDTNTHGTPTQRPYFVTEFEDSVPSINSFQVIPNQDNPVLPEVQWSISDSDSWYGILHIDDKQINNQYHNAVIHYPLNEGKTDQHNATAAVPVENISGITTTISGPIYSIEGLAGNALNFDGNDDYVECNNGASNDPTATCTTEMSIVAHIIPDSASDQRVVVSQYSRDDREKFRILLNSSNQVEARVNWAAGSDYVELTSSSVIPNDSATPTNIIVTVDTTLTSGNVKLFINGKLEDITGAALATGTTNNWELSSNIHGGSSEIYIGNSASSGTNGFDGKIEEIVIYDKCIYPVVPKNNSFIINKPYTELASNQSLAQSKSMTAKLFVKDFHNIRGSTVNEVATSAQVSWRKAAFALDTTT